MSWEKKCQVLCVYQDAQETGRIVEFSDCEKEILASYILDDYHKAGCPTEEVPIFDSDFLYIYLSMHNILLSCFRIMCMLKKNDEDENRRTMPFIQLVLTDEAGLKRNENGEIEPDDKTLNAGISWRGDRYILSFERNFLGRIVHFLQVMFDSNEEMIISNFPKDFITKFNQESLVTKDEAIYYAKHLLQCGATALGTEYLNYALSRNDKELLSKPVCLKSNEKLFPDRLVLWDKEKQRFFSPMKKKIFSTKGFHEWFYRKKELVSTLFFVCIDTLLSHEIAHMLNRHCMLRAIEPDFCGRQEIGMCAEVNADETSIRWQLLNMISEVDGNKVPYLEKDFKDKTILTVLGAYVAQSWIYRDDERKWSLEAIEEFLHNQDTRHPIFQIRAYHVVNCAFDTIKKMGEYCQNHNITTYDDIPINQEYMNDIKQKSEEMLFSFEKYFDETYRDERDMRTKLQDSLVFEDKSIPACAEEIPFLIPENMQEASDAANAMKRYWPELRSHILKYCSEEKQVFISDDWWRLC